MAEHTSMAEALWRTLRELRYAGIRAQDLAARDFTASPAKREEIVALLGACERYLETSRVADMPAVLEEARRHPDWCPIAPRDVVLELPDILWSPAVRRFLDSLPAQRVVARTIALPDVTIPERARAAQDEGAAIVERVEIEAARDADRLRFLQAITPAVNRGAEDRQAGGGSQVEEAGDTLQVFHAGGRDAEIDEVFRRILAAGLPLDAVEIVCASDAYGMLVSEKAARMEWPVTLASGVPATATRPGRLLLRLCDWVESDFQAAELRALLQAGDCRDIEQAEGGRREAAGPMVEGGRRATAGGDSTPAAGRPRDSDAAEEEGSSLSPAQAARLLLKAQATRGRLTYAPALTRLAEKYERRAKDPELSGDDREWNACREKHARQLLAWIETVLRAIPVPGDDGQVELRSVVEAARVFLEAHASRVSVVDRVALAALPGALDELRALGNYCCALPSALRFLRERVASLVVARDRPRPGHLHVSSLADAGYDGRRLVFVVGLQEGAVFPAAIEDPVLLDDERKAIHPLLRTSAERQDEAVFGALSRLAAIGATADRVCLSFSCRDTREFRETFPSWIVLQAFRLKMRDPTRTHDDLKKWLGEPVSAVPPTPAQAASEAGWWLAQVKSRSNARDAILRAHPDLAKGLVAQRQRASDAFTEFDGLVPIAGPALDPTRTGRPVSATTLESAAQCPLRFFMEHGLGVRLIEEGRTDEDAWLDPPTRGSELHALFARALRAARDEQRRPAVAIDRPRLRAWGQRRLEELREEMPPPSEEVFARESQDFLDDLDAFIEAECDGRHGPDPVGFEVAFGFPLDEETEPLAREEPVAIDLGGKRRVVLHGRIDRINRVRPGEYEVIDYKTGGYWPDDWKGEFAGGTRLQHALYGVAAAALLKPQDPKARVVRGVYLFPAVKGRGRRKTIPAPSREKLGSVLRDLADVIGHGVFAPASADDACKWCEFKAACHVDDVEGTRAKMANQKNAVLKPYRDLRGNHE
jgi:ATP-dependent helicase/nuclease subunit B